MQREVALAKSSRFFPCEKNQGDIEKVKAAFASKAKAVDDLMASPHAQGDIDGVKFRRSANGDEVDATSFGLGKQQPVWFLNVELTDGIKCDVVEKHDDEADKILAWRRDHECIRIIYPPVLHSGEKGYLIPHLDGIGGTHSSKDSFGELVEGSDDLKTQLFSDTYEMLDEVFKGSPLLISDVQVTTGHNLIYDNDLERFRLFDYGTILERPGMDKAEKHLRFISEQSNDFRTASELDIEFLMYYVKRFKSENPGEDLSLNVPRKEYMEEDQGYRKAHVRVYGELPKNDGTIVVEGGYKDSIHPEVLKAIDEGDKTAIRTFIDSSNERHRILLRENIQ